MTIKEHVLAGQTPKSSRRQFVVTAGAGIGLTLAGAACRGDECTEGKRVLKRGDTVEVNGRVEEILEKAYQLGFDYEKRHGGCCRCTVAALQDALPFVAIDGGLFRGASCLDGGATPQGLQNCGAFTGLGMVIGYLCGCTREDDKFRGGTRLAHDLIRKVYHRFAEEYGTVLCRDVRKGAEGDCPKVVGRAAQWTAEALLEEFTYYEAKRPEDEQRTPTRPSADPSEGEN